MNVLEIKNIKKSFNDQTLHVLQDISLTVAEGEVVAIIGPSGSGKSTLLRCATLLRTRARFSRAWASSISCVERFWANSSCARAADRAARSVSIFSAHSKVVGTRRT